MVRKGHRPITALCVSSRSPDAPHRTPTLTPGTLDFTFRVFIFMVKSKIQRAFRLPFQRCKRYKKASQRSKTSPECLFCSPCGCLSTDKPRPPPQRPSGILCFELIKTRITPTDSTTKGKALQGVISRFNSTSSSSWF